MSHVYKYPNYFDRHAKKRKFKKTSYAVVPVNMGKPGRAVSSYGRARMNQRTGGLLGIENKFYDSVRQDALIPSTVDWTSCEFNPGAPPGCLNAPAQGDGPENRDGNVITMHSIFIQGYVNTERTIIASTAALTFAVRVALVLDTQCRGAQLNSEDVYGSESASQFSAVYAPLRNMSYTTRFKVLKQKLIQLDAPVFDYVGAGVYAINESTRPFHMKYKFKGGLKVRYTTGSTTSDVANVTDNALFVIMNATYGAVGTQSGGYTARLRFPG